MTIFILINFNNLHVFVRDSAAFIRKRSELINIYMLCTLYFSYRYAINTKLWSLYALLSQTYVTSRNPLKVIM